jgi:hypothetical protein
MQSTIYRRAAAVAAATALELAVSASNALAAAHTATGGGAAATGTPSGGGTSLTTVAQNAGTTVHTVALVLIGICLAVTAVIAVALSKPKVLLVGVLVAVGAFFFVNGGAANVAGNTANGLANGSGQSQAAGNAGIPGITGP